MAPLRKGPNTTDYPTGIPENTYANLVDAEITALWEKSACWLSSVVGTNTITAAASPTIESYNQPMAFWLIPANANTGGVTINIDGVGAINLKDASAATLNSGDLVAGKLYLIVYDGAQFRLFETGGNSGNITSAPDVIVTAEFPSGTGGGTLVSGAWRDRPLNTERRNVLSGASLASNEVTLQPGTYYIEWWVVGFTIARHMSKLVNSTDSSDIQLGSSELAAATPGQAGTKSRGSVVLVITSAKAIKIQHRSTTSQATTGMGAPTSIDTETYTELKVWKVGELVSEVSGRHGGGIAITYDYRTGGGSPDDPGLGGLMFNDINFEGSPQPDRLFLDNISNDLTDWTDALRTISGGQGRIVKEDDPTKWVVFTTLSRSDADSSFTNFTITIDDASSTTPFTDGDGVIFMMGSPGAQGAPGDSGATVIFQASEPSTAQGSGSIWVKDNAQLNLYELSGSPLEWVYTGKNLKGADGKAGPDVISQGTQPSVNFQDGSLWIDTSSGDSDLYILTGSPSEWVDTGINMQAADGASIVTQATEPSTNYQDGSLWIKTNDELNLYELQGSPSEWVYTGQNMKGAAGKDGPQVFVAAIEPTVNAQDGSLWVKDNAQANLYILTGSPSEWVYTGIDLKGLPGTAGGQIYAQAGEPTTNVQDGSLWIKTNEELNLYILTGSPSEWVYSGSNLRGQAGKDGPSVYVQVSEPTTNVQDGSLWIKNNAQLNLYILTGSPSEWVYTGSDLKGTAGKDGPSVFAQAGEPTTNIQDGSLWIKTNAQLNLYILTGSPSEWVYTGTDLKGLSGTAGAQIFSQAAAPTVNVQDGSLWIDSDSSLLDLYELQGSPSEWVDTGINLKGDKGWQFQGPFTDGTQYAVDDVVSYQNVLYIAQAIIGGSPTEIPGTSPSSWDILLDPDAVNDIQAVTVSGARDITIADRGKVLRCTAALTLSPDPIATLTTGFFCYISATGGAVTIDPDGSEQVDGSLTKEIADAGGALLWVESGAIYTLPFGSGGGGGSTDPFDAVAMFVAASL